MHHGRKTALTQLSFLFLKMSYPLGPSSRGMMCGEVLGFQRIGSHPLQKHGDVALPVLLGGAEGEPVVHHRSQRKLIHQSTNPPKTPSAKTLPPLRQAMIASRTRCPAAGL